jgi:hypothetical protein
MVGGVVRVSSHFLQFAVSSLGVRLSVVGLCSFIVIFFGYFFVLFAVLCFIILLIFPYLLQMVEEGIGPGRLWAFAGADAVGASQAGYWDSHWGVGVRCAGIEGQSRYVGGWRKEGFDFLWDLLLGQPDLPVEVWAGYCEQPAVCLWLEGSFFGVEWRVCVIQIMTCLFCHLLFIGLFCFCCKVFGFAWFFCVDDMAAIFVFNKVVLLF